MHIVWRGAAVWVVQSPLNGGCLLPELRGAEASVALPAEFADNVSDAGRVHARRGIKPSNVNLRRLPDSGSTSQEYAQRAV